MTENKQIIIDDVDVSGCGFIAKEDEYSLYDRVYKGQCRCSNEEMCKDHPNCFYKKVLKQLKCKEKECNKLYIQLKADEEYHKEEENTLRKIIKNKEERNIELFKENNKLKQTLTEIKEIVEKQCNICEALTPIDEYKDCKKCWQGVILQKSARYIMTNELEKTFFDTFGIEPRIMTEPRYSLNSEYYEVTVKNYPQITDHILLELICLNNIYLWETHTSTVNELKNVLLNKYIEHVNLMADENEKQEYIHQVQAIFKKE